MAGWLYILYEVFSGEAGKAAAKSGNKALVYCIWRNENDSYNRLGNLPIRLCIWLLNWRRECKLTKRYLQLADFINKIAFGLVIWAAAMQLPSARAR